VYYSDPDESIPLHPLQTDVVMLSYPYLYTFRNLHKYK